MKLRIIILCALFFALFPSRSHAQTGIIVRVSFGPQPLNQLCLLQGCTVSTALDGELNQLFLVTVPSILDPNLLLGILQNLPGVIDAELDQIVNMTEGLATIGVTPAGLTNSTPVSYGGTTVWQGYATQPASGQVQLPAAQTAFQNFGGGIVADIDTGVDPNHPALMPVLLQGYDFTRNQPGGSEMTDFTGPVPTGTGTSPVQVNQHTVAMVDSPTATFLLGNSQFSAFGHGTMVMGIIHLVAPQAKLLPLKAFSSNGTANLSNVLRAIYYGIQNNTNVINMSFDLTQNSVEFQQALAYATSVNVICVASAGNDGAEEIVYPAAYITSVMGVASVSSAGTPSTFSNYGDAIVWVAAPGEEVISTYPFGTYSAGSGTSFSAPFVTGTAALLLNTQPNINQLSAATAIAQAQFINSVMGNGLLDVQNALQSVTGTGSGPKIALSGTKLTFANQLAGTNSTSQTLVLSNTGTAPMTISSISLTGQNPADFSTTNNCSSTIAPQANCTITVGFSPAAIGLDTAAVAIVDNAPGSPHSATLVGLGTSPEASFSVSSVTYNSQLITTSSAPQSVVISNTGNSTLNFKNVAITGANAADFSLSNPCGATLAVSANCSVSISFQPTGTGTRTASLIVSDDATGSPQNVALTGSGTDFSLSDGSSGSNSATITAGQTGSFSMQIAPVNGFNGLVSVSCSGAPPQAVCSVTPSSVTLNGANSTNVVLTVQTSSTTSEAAAVPFQYFPGDRLRPQGALAFGCLLVLMALRSRLANFKLRLAWVLPLAVLILGFCGACGGSGGGSTSAPPNNFVPTPAGTYNVSVVATSSGVSHTSSFSLTVK
jgi:hypothetical protein